jgi:hypothetical protein
MGLDIVRRDVEGAVRRTALASPPALTVAEIARLFSPKDLGEYFELPKSAREVLVALHRQSRGQPYEGGQAELAISIGTSVRTVKRGMAILTGSGFVVEKRRQRPLPAVLIAHPIAVAAAAVERVMPAERRRPQRLVGYAIDAESIVMRCAAVLRSDGSRFVAAPYLVGLMTAEEEARCQVAAELGQPICEDPEVSAMLSAFFCSRIHRDRNAAKERVRLAFVAGMRDVVPRPVEDRRAA